MKTESNSRVRAIKAGVGILLALAALALIAATLIPQEVERLRANPAPNLGRLTDRPAIALKEDTGSKVLVVDWAYWQNINPDVVGWITIPGTAIDYPIVQAGAEDPTYYLDHDVYKNYNYYGCPYVDSTCTMESGNVLVFAHNMGGIDSSMFTELPNYLDSEYLAENAQVIIQTPDKVLELEVRAAESVSPYGYTKHTVFSSTQALRDLYLKLWEGADSKSAEPAEEEIEQLFALVTCDKGGSARTLVYVG